ncbi:MAG TPA: tail fiber protein [Chitinophagaceae bacterium]|nr:tail fiber protein [Chitinophagaceae bacterium]
MEGTIGEIRLFAGNFAPRNWAFCAGQLMSISQNTALFSILGTTYGGNGQTTFALPDLRARTAVGPGQGPGLSNITLGEVSGTETVTLLTTQMPAHNHTLSGVNASGTTGNPTSSTLATTKDATDNTINSYATATPAAVLHNQSIGISGNSQPVPIRNPYLGMNYIICLFGIFPSRN